MLFVVLLQEGPIAQELSWLDRPERAPGMVHLWGSPKVAVAGGLPHKFEGGGSVLCCAAKESLLGLAAV